MLFTTCRKQVTEPEYESPFDETSAAYVPTPGLNTAPITGITAIAAITGGVFENNYGKPATAKGVCWSLVENPTLTLSCTNDGPGTSSFTSSLVNLLPDTLYYVLAYATNEAGTTYGGQRSFRTRDGRPVFSGFAITDVTTTGSKLFVSVDDGGLPVSARGFCYSKDPDPTTEDTCIASGSGMGAYSIALTGLDRATTYYVRPYATNSVMTGYGAQTGFVTAARDQLPTVTTGEATTLTANSAKLSGDVLNDGGAAVTARGICHSLTQNPTTSDTCTGSGNGVGGFTVDVTGLTFATGYFARAYATNAEGTAYGTQIQFTTLPMLPTVNTGSASTITVTSAVVAGEVTATGGATVTARGVCWSTTPNPTISGTCAASGSGMGAFSATLTGLAAGTLHYVRAYATNSAGTAYGAQIEFNTLSGLPIVQTGGVSRLTSSGATLSGEVTSIGSSTVTSRGICYSTSQNPTTSTNCANSGNGVGAFTAAITGLTANSTYYTRSYATNSTGTSYGNQVQFTTTPTVTDIDGNVYQTVQIGSQLWMAANLKTARYRNGTSISNPTSASAWAGTTSGGWVSYGNSSSNNTTYGKLYNWYAVSNSAGLCPTGWHIPSDSEWSTLSNSLDNQDVGFKLKSTEGWASGGNGSNSSGFSALPGGARSHDGTFGEVGGLPATTGSVAYFWTSTESNATYVWNRFLTTGRNFEKGPFNQKTNGYSVRCVKD